MDRTTSQPMFHLALLLNRLAIGLYLLLAGVGKITGGIGNFVDKGFRPLQPEWLPDAVATPYAYSLPVLEAVVGAMLALGLFTRTVATISLLMIASFTIALVVEHQTLKHGSGPFNANFIYMTLLFLLAVTGAGRFGADHLLLARKTGTK